MNLKRLGLVLCLGAALGGSGLFAQNRVPLVCGIALGFPPYQFRAENGDPAGIDAEIARLVFQKMGTAFRFDQRSWDELYLGLAHLQGSVDLLCGAEINAERRERFDFSRPYYRRAVVIFVRAGSRYQSVDDLNARIVAGDRDGFIESLIDTRKLRIVDTKSKEEGFRRLKNGEVEAVIAPLEVGRWIGKQLALALRTLPERDEGSPVAFAVAKGNTALAGQISRALDELERAGEIEAVMKKYQ